MALEVRIRKNFPDFQLNTEFTMDGGCTGILGASGCGKSMTLKCIAGVERPDEGRIVLNGRVLYDSEKKINLSPQERHAGYLFQNYALFPTMTVEENLSILLSGGKEEKAQLVGQQLARFHLEGLEKRYPSQLSGGQQQRVALARMLLRKPEIIMLDEPFSALDGHLKDILQMEMLQLIHEFEGDTLLVSHSRDEIFKFCDSMVLLEQGSCILKGDTREIFAHPRKMEAARLTGCKNISAIKRLGDYELYAVDWKMKFTTAIKITEDIRYVAIRGHRLKPRQENAGENIMEITQVGYSEMPFEKQYLFRNVCSKEAAPIWWMMEKGDFDSSLGGDLPRYMEFPKEHLMLLS